MAALTQQLAAMTAATESKIATLTDTAARELEAAKDTWAAGEKVCVAHSFA